MSCEYNSSFVLHCASYRPRQKGRLTSLVCTRSSPCDPSPGSTAMPPRKEQELDLTVWGYMLTVRVHVRRGMWTSFRLWISLNHSGNNSLEWFKSYLLWILLLTNKSILYILFNRRALQVFRDDFYKPFWKSHDFLLNFKVFRKKLRVTESVLKLRTLPFKKNRKGDWIKIQHFQVTRHMYNRYHSHFEVVGARANEVFSTSIFCWHSVKEIIE